MIGCEAHKDRHEWTRFYSEDYVEAYKQQLYIKELIR